MKIYLYISPSASKIDLWQDYLSKFGDYDRTDQLTEADLLHILGVWNHRGARLAHKASQMGIPYIISPLGGISKWNMLHPRTKRILQRLNYQKSMLQKADAVLATTPLEMQYLRQLKWNTQLYHIPNSVLTHSISDAEMEAEISDMYEKVWSRYERRKAERINERVGEETPENAILKQLFQILSRMPHKNIPQRYFDQLQILLHDTDYDEDLLVERMKKLKILKFARRIFHVMSLRTGLTEGFMPVPALDDRRATTILNYCRPKPKIPETSH